MKTKKNKPLREFEVNIQFNVYEFVVKARTAGEAKKKAYAKVRAKGYSAIDHKNTFIDRGEVISFR